MSSSEDERVGSQNDQLDSDLEIVSQEEETIQQFGLKAINNEERIKERLEELKANFYNSMASKKLIKKEGRVPFIEHLTVGKRQMIIYYLVNDKPVDVPDTLAVHDDIKRELAFYNMTRENVRKGMEILF